MKIALSAIMTAVGNNLGFCRHCGAEAYGVEPDAHEYECDVCGAFEVFGAEELLIMGEYE